VTFLSLLLQVVQQVASRLRHVLTESIADAQLCELACIVVDPGAPAQALHYDTPLLDGESALITIFVPLQDISGAMGATCLLPASHTSVEAHTAYLAAADKAQRQRYVTECCAYRSTGIHSLSMNYPPPPPSLIWLSSNPSY